MWNKIINVNLFIFIATSISVPFIQEIFSNISWCAWELVMSLMSSEPWKCWMEWLTRYSLHHVFPFIYLFVYLDISSIKFVHVAFCRINQKSKLCWMASWFLLFLKVRQTFIDFDREFIKFLFFFLSWICVKDDVLVMENMANPR